MKAIHISEVPVELIKVRDRWRYFWSQVPLLGELYRRHIYVRRMNKWMLENGIDVISHEGGE